jgi:hypothetical protein
MKFHFLLIIVNLISAFGQSTNNNDLISSDVLSIIAKAKQDVRSYLSTILVDRIIINVDAIFAEASSNITSLINRNYNCLQITTTTIKKLNKRFLDFATNGIDSQLFYNNPAIQGCINVERATINNIEYNIVADYYVGLYLYDTNWVYKSTFNMPSIHYAIVANDYYYFTNSENSRYRIIKTTFTSPTVLNSYGWGYRGLYYDSVSSRIIAAGCDISSVDTFDLDLNILSSVSVGNCPHGVTVYNSKIYVAKYYSLNVAVISNGVVENTYPTVCSNALIRISVDSFGYFALSCGNGQAYLYDSNMQYTSKSIGIGVWVGNVKFDTNNRLAVCGSTVVKIFN